MAKLVRQYQTHSHSNYCRRNHSCWFGFPKVPSPRTVICGEPDDSDDRDTILKAAHVILGKVHEIIDNATDTQTLE